MFSSIGEIQGILQEGAARQKYADHSSMPCPKKLWQESNAWVIETSRLCRFWLKAQLLLS